MTSPDAKAADSHASRWVGGHSLTFSHSVFSHGFQRHRFAPNLDFWDWDGGWWAGYHYCGGWVYQYGYAPALPETQSVWSAVTNRLMLADDGRSLQIDLVGGYWPIPVSDIPGSRESTAPAPVERASPQVSGSYCFLGCRQDGIRRSLRAGA